MKHIAQKQESALGRSCRDSLITSNNTPAHFTKTDSIAVSLAPAGDGQSVTVFEPFAGFTVGQL
jgi:hypothetical protein